MAKTNILKHPIFLMIEIFVLLNILGILFRKHLQNFGIDLNMALISNLILFMIGVFTLWRSLKAIDNPNPHAFVRSFYSGFLIRLAAVAVAAFLYIYSQKGNVNKESLFVFMGIYAIYSIVEVSALRKVLKEKKNA